MRAKDAPRWFGHFGTPMATRNPQSVVVGVRFWALTKMTDFTAATGVDTGTKIGERKAHSVGTDPYEQLIQQLCLRLATGTTPALPESVCVPRRDPCPQRRELSSEAHPAINLTRIR